MKKAMFPGSFDPPTLGHMNLIERATALFDKLYIVVADNIKKNSFFTNDEKLEILNELYKDNYKIEIVSYSGLMVEFARENKIDVMIRGVRAQDDFNFEFELAMNNKMLYPELEVIFLPTDIKHILTRSSQVKELAHFNVDVSSMVPEIVNKKIFEKIREEK